MVLAVFSDIHGNVSSLEEALNIMETFKPDQYLFLGDMAGYYYYQNESIELLNSLDSLVSIKGNHDEYFLKCLSNKNELKKLDKKYGQSYSLLYRNITEKSKEFFYSLAEFEKNEFYEAYHGSPNNFLEEYIYKETDIQLNTTVPFIFLGHTHYPMTKKVNDTLIVNPGSIGQPRDYNKGSFSIIDLKDKKVENIRYTYEKSQLEKKITKLEDNKYLQDVLKREKK